MAKKNDRSAAHTPEFLAKAGLFDGDWMPNSKLTVQALIRPEIFPLKVNVLGVLMAQTFGYATELGVVMRKLKKHENIATSKTIVKVFPTTDRNEMPAVTEVITPQGIASKIKMAWLDAYKESGVAPSPEQLQEIKEKLSRQHMRRILQETENDGLIERVRANCQPQKLSGLSFMHAIEQGLITPLSALPDRERKKLGGTSGGLICVYLLAKPKPAKTYAVNVAKDGYIQASKVLKLLHGPQQTVFGFMVDEGFYNPKVAAEIAATDELQSLLVMLSQAEHNYKATQKAVSAFVVQKARELSPGSPEEELPLFAAPADDQPRAHKPKPIEELSAIGDAARSKNGKWNGANAFLSDDEVRKIFAACRDEEATCTVPEVVQSVLVSMEAASSMKKPVSSAYPYLLKVAPQFFEKPRFQHWRDSQRKESPAAAAACPSCEGSGLIGLKCTSIEETIDAVRTLGAQYCECPEGETARMLVEPAVMRRSAS